MKPLDIGFTVFVFVSAYTIGSIPIGYFIAKSAGVEDIREHGSGNIGATNVARTLGPLYFIPVFVLDFLKAYLTVQSVSYFWPSPGYFYVASCGYLVGNGYSFLLNFTGGKGVAATAGILASYDPNLLFIALAGWGLGYMTTHVVGIASIIGAGITPVCAFLLDVPWHGVLFVTALSAWIIVRHYENIKKYCST
jgi:acyl phosphate:glycerol-3-phosphate acyltransferase